MRQSVFCFVDDMSDLIADLSECGSKAPAFISERQLALFLLRILSAIQIRFRLRKRMLAGLCAPSAAETAAIRVRSRLRRISHLLLHYYEIFIIIE